MSEDCSKSKSRNGKEASFAVSKFRADAPELAIWLLLLML